MAKRNVDIYVAIPDGAGGWRDVTDLTASVDVAYSAGALPRGTVRFMDPAVPDYVGPLNFDHNPEDAVITTARVIEPAKAIEG